MFDVVVLLALFQPMQFDDSFHHIIATNVYVNGVCNSSEPLSTASKKATEQAIQVLAKYDRFNYFPIESLEILNNLTEAELIKTWMMFAKRACPQRFSSAN
jgi:hypothetical protein